MPATRPRYHRLAFELIDATPILSERRLGQLAEWEGKEQARLPGALREYLALEELPDGTRANPKAFLRQHGKLLRASQTNAGLMLPFGTNEWGASVHVLLDGRDDPAVFLQPSHNRRVRSFSLHVFDRCWAALLAPRVRGAEREVLTAVEPFGPVGLDFLRDHFAEASHYIHEGLPLEAVNLPGERPRTLANGEYRFFAPGVRIEVRSVARVTRWEEGTSVWVVVADSAPALLGAAARLWRWGTLAQTLRASTPAGEDVLHRLREQYGGP